MIAKTCPECGKTFDAKRSDQKFCTPFCKLKYNRSRKASDPGPVPPKELEKPRKKPKHPTVILPVEEGPLFNIIANLQEPVILRPVKPLKIVEGKATDRWPDRQCIEEWQKMIQRYKEIILSDENKLVKQEACRVLIAEASRSSLLTPAQRDGIIGRCNWQIEVIDHPEKGRRDLSGAMRMQEAKGIVSKFKQTSLNGL
jgi:hypothetical protein